MRGRLFARRSATSTDYRRPYRPRVIRLANRLMRGLGGRGWRISLDESSLIEAAEERTGLLDLGDATFRQPMRVLLRAIDEEARLHPIGRYITRERLISTLATRMRLEELVRRHPRIESERTTKPIVIVGLPRTGTTLLHRLLASDARIRTLSSWEALSPVPLDPAGADLEERQKRVANAQRAESGLRWMAPDFFAVHPVDALAPEEDVLLLDLAFRSTVPESTLRVPSYAMWLEEQDQTPAYRYMKRVLQALQWQRPAEGEHARWVLKTPHHLEWLDVLLDVFPDATIVWTHRDPQQVVPSFCSMLAHGRGVFSDDVDPHEIGRSWLRKGTRMMTRAMDVRKRVGDARFVDVRYGELMENPLAVVRRIEERTGMPWTKDAETRMRDTLRSEVQHRHGVHRYRLSDFGLAERDVDRALEHYRDAFRV
ncbi:sulfotransferase family protein [Sandaracinus amylolyticus]|uniref:sulfotransferase family protein n=1 Tax=Sandaracinus amylolyticus TaxID=927083 RepID=UPI001F418AAA|nr:sulfotransferase [Sandaracinus amylolyticus]UJR79058.1 Sulfotransferase [Sandaracinus amylolyticus]